MMDDERPGEKIRRVGVTTLAKLVTGEDVCHLKPWYEKRHPDEAPPPGPELARWQMEHNLVVTKIVQGLQGGDVEREMWLSLDKPPVIGKTDVTHRLPGEIHIYEAKSGRQANSHPLQLLIYLYMARKGAMEGVDGTKLTGHLVYPDKEVVMRETDIHPNLEQMMEPHIQEVLSDSAPRPVRNPACRWCWADCQFAGKRSQVKASGSG